MAEFTCSPETITMLLIPTPVFWPREFHGLYSPWSRKESDMTELLSLSLQSVLSTKQVFSVIVVILISKFWE